MCETDATPGWFTEPGRDYWRCGQCALVFLSPHQRPDLESEVRRYRLHRNSADDAGYVAFLSRLADPLLEHAPPGAMGIDYGCGPAPVLARLLTRQRRPTVSYDPVFFPDEALLATTYDFITCSEVVEHAHEPKRLFGTLARLVRPGGHVAIMTRWYDGHDFAAWSYRRDPTHVCFFSERTMRWVASRFAWSLTIPAPDIALYRT